MSSSIDRKALPQMAVSRADLASARVDARTLKTKVDAGTAGGAVQSALGRLASELELSGAAPPHGDEARPEQHETHRLTGRYGDTFEGERWNRGADARPINLGHGAGHNHPSTRLANGAGDASWNPLEEALKATAKAAADAYIKGKYGGDDKKAFDAADTNHDGGLDRGEVNAAVVKVGIPGADKITELAMKAADTDNDGKITYAEAQAAKKKLPREDQDGGGGWRPIPLGQGKSPLHHDDGGDDGNDDRRDASGGGVTRADLAHLGHRAGAADGRVRKEERGTLSFERAMQANRYTDPKRG